MAGDRQNLTPDRQSEIETYLGFALHDASVANYVSRNDPETTYIHNDRVVESLRHVAGIFGFDIMAKARGK